MAESSHLRLAEVRAALRVVGECRDLGYDPVLWLRHTFEGLQKLVGVRVVMGGEVHWHRPDGPITPVLSMQAGLSPSEEQEYYRYFRERKGGLQADVIVCRLKTVPIRNPALTRRQLLPDRVWYRSPQFDEYHRPTGIDHCIAGLLELPGGLAIPSGLHRAAGERDFSSRELRLVRLFYAELGRLIGPVLVPASDPYSPTRLPARVRETLQCLLDGDSEKQAAARMGLSRVTVHQYVRALYQHYQVASRAELLARVLRRKNPGG
jgi:DNA-binding CsgD family transcriptional regulator